VIIFFFTWLSFFFYKFFHIIINVFKQILWKTQAAIIRDGIKSRRDKKLELPKFPLKRAKFILSYRFCDTTSLKIFCSWNNDYVNQKIEKRYLWQKMCCYFSRLTRVRRPLLRNGKGIQVKIGYVFIINNKFVSRKKGKEISMNFHKDLSFEKFGSLLLDNSQSSEE